MPEPITAKPHMVARMIPAFRDRRYGEHKPARVIEERDPDFPWFARSGAVSAIGRTSEGAVAMVERILAARGGAAEPEPIVPAAETHSSEEKRDA